MDDYLKDCPDVLTPKNLMELLGISEPTIYRLLKAKKIKSVRIGSMYRIPKCYLSDYLLNESQMCI